ncbi:MAG: oxidoreductase domain protein [Paenibacillaceae bacterium]|jgi:predicted dehydrogenase|nr:oxidoreductase domain protein [Paenibacillaceae bacterium]
MKQYNAALIGIGGFGKNHTKQMVEHASERRLKCVAFAEPNPEANRPYYDSLVGIGVKPYVDYREMIQAHPEIDFVAIATPIALHKPMCVYAMEHGMHALTEKPPAVTVQDVEEMAEVSRRTGKLCSVSFQMTGINAFRKLLELLRDGAVGELKQVTGTGLWHRTDEYYARTAWAGKLTQSGQYVLDGTMNNPFSHLLNNCLYAAGMGDPAKAAPVRVQAELYHGHAIDAEDTSCVRIETACGVDVRFYATLCHSSSDTPQLVAHGTAGKMVWDYGHRLKVVGADGNERVLEFPKEDLTRNMYMNLMEAIAAGDAGQKTLYCPVDACRSFVQATNGAFESAKAIHPLPVEYWERLSVVIARAAAEGKLFSELGEPWAVPSAPFALDGYRRFALYQE